ncbi:hypothetical protein, partial [Gluconobacter sp. P1D12_c]|uniref:hypothetical protein n=1 Tax=Gluconobacter sp. P1D12_c TaxID=2762614 RepID=UPI001C041B61
MILLSYFRATELRIRASEYRLVSTGQSGGSIIYPRAWGVVRYEREAEYRLVSTGQSGGSIIYPRAWGVVRYEREAS